MNCLVFWAHCKNVKISTKRQVYNKGIFTILGYFLIIILKKMVLLECAVDSERNDVNDYVVSCSVAELFIH